MAKQVNSKPDNLFFVQNATDGINSLAKSLDWKKGDVVALPNTAYSCVKKTVQYLVEKFEV